MVLAQPLLVVTVSLASVTFKHDKGEEVGDKQGRASGGYDTISAG